MVTTHKTSSQEVDLVITFRALPNTTSKQKIREEARKAERQYSILLQTLHSGGLKAVGRSGEKPGDILVFVWCPLTLINHLVKRERHSDFLHGLPPTSQIGADLDRSLSPADRLRIVHDYVTSTPADHGLGVHPGSPDWCCIQSVMVLHDQKFNAKLRDWSTHPWHSQEEIPLKTIREHFGDSIALYFDFLSSYTTALIFPAVIGVLFHFFGTPYSPLYSTLLLLWSVIFVEWWRIRERLISLRNGTIGSVRTEKRRPEYVHGFPWWKRELRMAASLPVILLFIAVLTVLLTWIFVIEAFVTTLYTGPGRKFISFSPTILFAILVPRILAVYHSSAVGLTKWENHAYHSTHTKSLTLKVFTLSAIVSYLGLALSAFVYVPYGEAVMDVVQTWLFSETPVICKDIAEEGLNATMVAACAGKNLTGIWEMDVSNARLKLNPSRLQNEMFTYTVTNQIVTTFTEVGLPYILRAFNAFRNKKRVVIATEQREGEGREEEDFLEVVKNEVALPDYEIYEDYSEMVSQFGYVALWSTIWPLAPAMALLNNSLEYRSDAFKITVHSRRPIPTRTDTIGPWLDSLTFLTWLSALTNSSLVYLFRPQVPGGVSHTRGTRELLMFAFLIALAASHGYIILQVVVRHLVQRAIWLESKEVREKEKMDQAVKESYFRSLGGGGEGVGSGSGSDKLGKDEESFWGFEEGLAEIQKLDKDE